MPSSYAEAIRQGKQQKSLYKFFLSFMVLADMDVQVRAGNENYEFPYRKIRISEKFWRADGCFRTGQCCSKVNMDLFLSMREFEKLQQLYPGQLQPWQSMQLQLRTELKEDSRGRGITTYHNPIVWTSIGGNKCAYLDRHMGPDGYLDPKTGKQWEVSGCTIHLLNPIHCALPHLYLDIRNTKKPIEKQYVNVTKRQFGRNWAFGCPVEFTRYNEFARRRDLELFNRCRDLLIEYTGTAKRVEDIIARIQERDLLEHDNMLPLVL